MAEFDLPPHRFLDETGQGFAFLQYGFGGLAQFRRDAQRGEGGGFHVGLLALQMRCMMAHWRRRVKAQA